MTEREAAAPELLRTRARAVATLVATGTGVVVAAVAFGSVNPVAALSTPTRVVGAAAAALLVVSTCLYIAASSRTAVGKVQGGSASSALQDLNDSIRKRAWWGGLSGTAGAVVLLLALPVAIIYPYDETKVVVQLTHEHSSAGVDAAESRLLCPALPDRFEAKIPVRELTGSSNFVPLEVEGPWCGGLQVLLPRPAIAGLAQASE